MLNSVGASDGRQDASMFISVHSIVVAHGPLGETWHERGWWETTVGGDGGHWCCTTMFSGCSRMKKIQEI